MAGAATVEKALDVLFHLHASATPLGLTAIGRDLDLPKSSCHRLLAPLVDREVVERDERGRYRPGLALLALGLGAQAHEPVVHAARAVLEAEAAVLGETVFLVARRRERLRVLDRCEGSGFLRAAPEIGDVVPIDVTAVGRLYRIFRDSDSTTEILETDPSPVDPEDARVCAKGYALNRDAWIEGLSVLAVPIWQTGTRRGPHRELVATLALGAASARFEAIGEARIAERLLAAADVVHERLGLRLASIAGRDSLPHRKQAPGRAKEDR